MGAVQCGGQPQPKLVLRTLGPERCAECQSASQIARNLVDPPVTDSELRKGAERSGVVRSRGQHRLIRDHIDASAAAVENRIAIGECGCEVRKSGGVVPAAEGELRSV